MLDFIWHLRGHVPIDEAASDDAVLDRVEDLLKQQCKPITHHSGSSIAFRSATWGHHCVDGRSAMFIYDQGFFWIEKTGTRRILRYDLRSLHGFLFCIFGALFFYGFVMLSAGAEDAPKVALLTFIWLYGGNMVLAWRRIPKSIRKALEA